MKKIFIGTLCLWFSTTGFTQNTEIAKSAFKKRLSYSVQLDFQGFSLPFSQFETYLKSKGVSVGVGYDWNTRRSLQQVIKLGTFFNQYHGNSVHLSTALQYNPLQTQRVTAGISLGVGYMRTGSAEGGWLQSDKGEWNESSNKIGLLFIPASLQVSAKAFENNKLTLSPMVSYQVNALRNYSPAMPIQPQSILSIGSKINLK